MISITDIERAQRHINSYLYPTPCIRSPWLEEYAPPSPVFCKLEHLQQTGSFKIRGALNGLLNLDAAERAKGVVTASAGNHGLGVAQAARWLRCSATVFVPTTASPVKVSKLRHLGVTLIEEGRDYDEAEVAANAYAKSKGLVFVHAFEQPEIIAGQGTVGLEISEQMAGLPIGKVVIPVGGGGLMGGIAIAMKTKYPQTQIIGVQSEASPAMARSLAAGKAIETPIAETIADGLAGRFVAEIMLRLAQKYCDEMILVQEKSIRNAIREFYFRHGWRVEGSAAVAAAALLENKLKGNQKPIVLILTGGNIAEEQFGRIIANN